MKYEGIRAYLTGRKETLSAKLEGLQKTKEQLELNVIDLMMRLETISKEYSEKIESEMGVVRASIELHDSMLKILDDESSILREDLSKDIKNELSNLEVVIEMTDRKVKSLFTTKKQDAPRIIKRTVIEEKKEEVPVEKNIVVPIRPLSKKQQLEADLFKPIQSDAFVYPKENYINSRGTVNMKFVFDRVSEYMKSNCPVMTRTELESWIDIHMPECKNHWKSLSKGVANIVQLYFSKDRHMRVSGGVYEIV